jgi:hypothetical protein
MLLKFVKFEDWRIYGGIIDIHMVGHQDWINFDLFVRDIPQTDLLSETTL